jgi:large subunit ribosomal protein L11
MEFCKAFNADREDEKGHADPDHHHRLCRRSFTFITKTPPATFLIKKAAGLKSGSKEPGKVSAPEDHPRSSREIAQAKMADLNANDIEAGNEDHRRLRPFDGPQVVEG